MAVNAARRKPKRPALSPSSPLAAGKIEGTIEGKAARRRRPENWLAGNRMELLQGAAEYFPSLIAAMAAARQSIYLETYILDPTASGEAVLQALMAAAQRGVAVHVVVDGVGTGGLTQAWREQLVQAGGRFRVFAPPGRWFVFMRWQWQRLHRKLCAVDGQVAFCGGINVLDDWHDPSYGKLEYPRLDFSVRVTGPVAQTIAAACHELWQKLEGAEANRPATLGAESELGGIQSTADALRDVGRTPGQAMLLLRDNLSERRSIERSYLRAIAKAKREVLIANAYFFPSRKLLAALRHAASRGVRVQLLLQGRYEYFLQFHATRSFYAKLLAEGVEIYEYAQSFLHAKVAVVDADLPSVWATVGSSNLDPLSLLLAREANLVSNQHAFAQELRNKLSLAIERGVPIRLVDLQRRNWRERLLDKIAYGLARVMVWLVKDHF